MVCVYQMSWIVRVCVWLTVICRGFILPQRLIMDNYLCRICVMHKARILFWQRRWYVALSHIVPALHLNYTMITLSKVLKPKTLICVFNPMKKCFLHYFKYTTDMFTYMCLEISVIFTLIQSL